MVATSDGHCKLLSPIMECPDVHPFAYRVPKPTKKPPTTIKKNPLIVKSDLKLNRSLGNKLLKSKI